MHLAKFSSIKFTKQRNEDGDGDGEKEEKVGSSRHGESI